MLAWIALAAFVALALALDLRSGGHATPSLRAALLWSIAWTLAGLGFAVVLAIGGDGASAGEYLAGFLIEKSLSLDNLFVFAVLLSFFAVPARAAPPGAPVRHRPGDRAPGGVHRRRGGRARHLRGGHLRAGRNARLHCHQDRAAGWRGNRPRVDPRDAAAPASAHPDVEGIRRLAPDHARPAVAGWRRRCSPRSRWWRPSI